MFDISQTTAPRSDQQNFDDYISGPRTVTIAEVRPGSDEQPVAVHLVEYPGRPYKPSKSMRRVLVAAWGPDAAAYSGRRMTLYGDPTVKFGGSTTGGIKISHLSHIAKPLNLSLTVTKGKRAPHTVQPLADEPTAPAADDNTITAEQSRRLHAALREQGIDRDAGLRMISDLVGRPVESTKQLTRDDAALVIETLEQGGAAEPEGVPTSEPLPAWPDVAQPPA